jgi:starch phosphorylase
MEKFCSLRMVMEYVDKLYSPAGRFHDRLLADGAAEARRLAEQVERVRSQWKNVTVGAAERDSRGTQRVGDTVQVTSAVTLGELRPDEVDIELYYGLYKSFSELSDSRVEALQVLEDRGEGRYLYGCTLACDAAGRFGFSVRATPRGDPWLKFTPGLLTWASE